MRDIFFLYEYAIRLEMKDAFFGCHESYRFPFPPFVLHLSPVLQDAGFSGFSGLLGFEKKKKRRMRSTNNKQRINKEGGGISFSCQAPSSRGGGGEEELRSA